MDKSSHIFHSRNWVHLSQCWPINLSVLILHVLTVHLLSIHPFIFDVPSPIMQLDATTVCIWHSLSTKSHEQYWKSDIGAPILLTTLRICHSTVPPDPMYSTRWWSDIGALILISPLCKCVYVIPLPFLTSCTVLAVWYWSSHSDISTMNMPFPYPQYPM